MNLLRKSALTGVFMLCVNLVQAQHTTSFSAIPEGIKTPDRVSSPIGTLYLNDGVPTQETTKRVYDLLDQQRATQTFLATIPLASIGAMKEGILSQGDANETVLLFEDLMDAQTLFLTPNASTIYLTAWLDLSEEPMVIEIPEKSLGFMNDSWFHYVADLGIAGADKGKGGKYLVLPPNYEGKIPSKGYHILRSNTYGNWILLRGFQVDGSSAQTVKNYKENFKIYKYSERSEAQSMNFKNVSGEFFNTIHRMDYGFWEEVNNVIQAETLIGLSPEVRGMLASIGIKKGEQFTPDHRMKQILTEAANLGTVMARSLTARPRDRRLYAYTPEESVWLKANVNGVYNYMNNGALELDNRTFFHFYATGVSPAMHSRIVGKGSQYLISHLDKERNVLSGNNIYKINLPANIPAKDFWSITIYDTQTRSMLQTDQMSSSIDNQKKSPKMNKDGSIDIYLSPRPIEGYEDNWIQTLPNRSFSTIFRLYGPLEPYLNQTWRPSDPIRIQ